MIISLLSSRCSSLLARILPAEPSAVLQWATAGGSADELKCGYSLQHYPHLLPLPPPPPLHLSKHHQRWNLFTTFLVFAFRTFQKIAGNLSQRDRQPISASALTKTAGQDAQFQTASCSNEAMISNFTCSEIGAPDTSWVALFLLTRDKQQTPALYLERMHHGRDPSLDIGEADCHLISHTNIGPFFKRPGWDRGHRGMWART